MKDQRKSQEDSLKAMFEKQKKLQMEIFSNEIKRGEVNYPQLVYTVTALIAEIGEVLQADKNWKNWKKQKSEVDRDALLDELVDVWHFVVNMSLYLGFDFEDVANGFKKKNEVNFKRQKEGY